MTTGTIVRNDRYTVTTSCGTDVSAGNYFSKSWSGVNDPVNHSKDNNYSMSLVSNSNPQCQYRIVYYDGRPSGPWLSGTYESCGFGVVAPFEFAVFDSNDEIKLLNKLGQSIRQHDFNAAVAIGEGRESLLMIKNRALQLARALRSLKSGNLSGFVQAIGANGKGSNRKVTIANKNNLFLEYEYGWRPLVNDIYEGAQAVFALTNKPLTRLYRASRKVELLLPETVTSSVITGKAVTVRAYRCRLTENYSPVSSLGLDSPSEVAWELLPWSFVADWVIPIGSYLQARSLVQNLKGAEIHRTNFQTLQKKRIHVNGNPGVWGYEIIGNGCSARLVNMSRSLVSLSVPSPKIKSFGKIASWRHAADAISLLIAVK